MKPELSLTDILIGMANYLPKEKHSFTYDSEKLNRFFYDKRKEYPRLLGEMRFDSDGRYPTSPDLCESIDTLIVSGILTVTLGYPFRYSFDLDCIEYYFSRHLDSLPEKTKKDLEKMSFEFQAIV